MSNELRNKGFSLTEVLISLGILAVGMLFIAGVFPVGIYFSTVSTERTTAAVVADEAFAKIRLYGVDLAPAFWPGGGCVDINDVSSVGLVKSWQGLQYEYYYPSANVEPTYSWCALCRRLGLPGTRDVQVTVFVCRLAGPHSVYQKRSLIDGTLTISPYPVPVFINVLMPDINRRNELLIDPSEGYSSPVENTFIGEGYTIVDDETGRIYRVLKRYPENQVIRLDRDFEPGPVFISNSLLGKGGKVWVIPPAVGGSRNPCVGVYQRVIRF